MKIITAKYSGFCFGVNRALAITRRSHEESGTVDVLGELVHNEDVVRELTEKGIRTIQRLAGTGRHRTLIIRAHGVPRTTLARARSAGYHVIDATCPMVKEIHAIARRQEEQGYRIIIIGDRDHAEVKGIAGQLKHRGLVIDPHEPWPCLPRWKKAAIVVQSTQDIDAVLPIVARLRPQIPDMQFFDTICRPTRQKQAEIKLLPRRVDIMIVIGSRNSANTKRLYELSRNLNRRSHWVQSARELRPRWLHRARRIGIAAGASTPQHTIKAVEQRIRQITSLNKGKILSYRRRSATRR